jgi:hypothetical protein
VDDVAAKVGPLLERIGDFRSFLGEDVDDASTYAALRKAEAIGRPMGSQEWLQDIERKSRLRCGPPSANQSRKIVEWSVTVILNPVRARLAARAQDWR